MVKIIEAHSSVTLIDAKEMLRRGFETLRKRAKQEEAFNAVSQDAHVGRQGNNGRSKWPQSGFRGRGRGSGGRGSGGRDSGSRGAGGRRAGGRGGDGSQRGRGVAEAQVSRVSVLSVTSMDTGVVNARDSPIVMTVMNLYLLRRRKPHLPGFWIVELVRI
ncbi:hypothetical protein GN244_ATG12058 [Phytophthora infestans]|uniref:Uncharacterized protein n=1 Tax=Phytophthora infestans TaxID=4787 RepID=A0A833WI38_PHYIN|nr:hypothetical protein GN244_ATG12058 [Phytophthora infestans]KAF4145668.1 hypothetical protein GN958_ATG05143 [Phytophthora infestans]